MVRSSFIALALLASCASSVLAQAYPLNYTPNDNRGAAASAVPAPIIPAPGTVTTAPQAPSVALPPRATGSNLPPVVDDVMTVGAPRPGPIDPSQPSSRDAVVQRAGGSDTSAPTIASPREEQRSLVGVRLAGSAQVLDGNTMRVQGRIVVLNGADAPELRQTCNDLTGVSWRCGDRSSAHLSRLTYGQSLICVGVEDLDGGAVAATCRIGTTDVGKTMVRDGHAVVPFWMNIYGAEQAEARASQRGVWSGTFTMPWTYRERL